MFGSGRDLGTYLERHRSLALAELDNLDPEVLLAENVDVLIAELLQRHVPDPVTIDWHGVTRSPVAEIKTAVRDPFFDDRLCEVPASRVVFRYPLSGDPELLKHDATTRSLGPKYGEVLGAVLTLTIEDRDLSAEKIKQSMAALRRDVEQRVEWANRDLRGFRTTLEQQLRQRYENRKQRILRDRALAETLGIPIQETGRPRLPIPARRKHVTLGARQKQVGFVPEPELDEIHYRDILDQTRSWARGLERTPGTLAKLGEEELRDVLLAHLNGYWQGAAGGELFNGAGKTDVLIRADDRNVFIGECKIWSGPKAAGEAADQLLSYLVWRDSKAALIFFIRTAKPVETIAKLHEAIEAHPRHVMTRPGGKPAEEVDYIFTADGEGRRISLAVIPVIQTV